jgi:hypothetical protein
VEQCVCVLLLGVALLLVPLQQLLQVLLLLQQGMQLAGRHGGQ